MMFPCQSVGEKSAWRRIYSLCAPDILTSHVSVSLSHYLNTLESIRKTCNQFKDNE